MRSLAICTALVLAVMAAGCAKQQELPVRQLPLSDHACRVIDRDPREITVSVVPSAGYLISGVTTNAEGLTHIFSQTKSNWGADIPVAIRATPETQFIQVWRVVEAASENGMRPRFDVRVPEIDWPKYLGFQVAGNVPEETSACRITCSTHGIQIDGRTATSDQLRLTLQIRGSLSPKAPVSISVAEDVTHQKVIEILDECQGACIDVRILGLESK